MCRVSIVIPCYNGERYLAEAIDSALAQTRPASEIIVVNDGSTDGSADIARAYGSRILLISTPNRGSSEARNNGAFFARAEFIKYLDADDILVPDALERQLAALTGAGSPVKEIIWGDWAALGEDGSVQEQPGPVIPPDMSQPEFLLRNNIQTSLGLYPKAAFVESGGFDPLIKNTDEYEFNFRLTLLGYRFRHQPGVVVNVRQHGGADRIAVRYALNRFPEGPLVLATQLNKDIVAAALEKGARAPLDLVVGERIVHAAADHLWSGRARWFARHMAWLRRFDPGWFTNPARLIRLNRMLLARLNFKLRN